MCGSPLSKQIAFEQEYNVLKRLKIRVVRGAKSAPNKGIQSFFGHLARVFSSIFGYPLFPCRFHFLPSFLAKPEIHLENGPFGEGAGKNGERDREIEKETRQGQNDSHKLSS